MKDTKAGPIKCGGHHRAAAALSMFGRTADLADTVQKYFDTADAQTPAERHRDVPEQIKTLEVFEADAGFAKLPKTKRDAVTDRLAELRAYQAYLGDLEKIPSVATATSNEKLKELEQQLGKLKVPVAYQTEWSETDAGVRRRALESDAQTLRRAVADLTSAYRKVADEAEELLRNSEAAGLPARAKKILMEADKLPSPDETSRPIPGASDVTYATVFAFTSVKAEYQRWQKAREQVKGLAKLAGYRTWRPGVFTPGIARAGPFSGKNQPLFAQIAR